MTAVAATDGGEGGIFSTILFMYKIPYPILAGPVMLSGPAVRLFFYFVPPETYRVEGNFAIPLRLFDGIIRRDSTENLDIVNSDRGVCQKLHDMLISLSSFVRWKQITLCCCAYWLTGNGGGGGGNDGAAVPVVVRLIYCSCDLDDFFVSFYSNPLDRVGISSNNIFVKSPSSYLY